MECLLEESLCQLNRYHWNMFPTVEGTNSMHIRTIIHFKKALFNVRDEAYVGTKKAV